MSIIKIINILLCLISFFSIFISGLRLNYFELADSINITSQNNEVLNNLSKNSNIAEFNRESNTLIFQNITRQELEEDINSTLNEEQKSQLELIEVKNPDFSLINIVVLNFIILISTVIAFFYFINKKFDKYLIETITIYISSIFLGLLYYVGFIFLLSNLYKIKVIELYILSVIPLLTSTIFILYLSKQNILEKISSKIKNSYTYLHISFLLIIIILGILAGSQFFITQSLVFISILFGVNALIFAIEILKFINKKALKIKEVNIKNLSSNVDESKSKKRKFISRNLKKKKKK